jgi:hypothetical protein
MLSQIGCIAVPPATLEKAAAGEPLTEAEERIVAAHPRVGEGLLAKIPRLEEIARMVGRQREICFDPAEIIGPDDVALGARLLKATVDLDRFCMAGVPQAQAIAIMRGRGEYNLSVLDALSELSQDRTDMELRDVQVRQLAPGMIIDKHVLARNGLLLLAPGQLVTDSVIARLESFRLTQGVIEPLRVLAPREE